MAYLNSSVDIVIHRYSRAYLWNLALVPAWANDLLDKSYSRNDLTVTFKQGIKSICLNFYKMKSLDWNNLMPMPTYKDTHEKDMLANLHGEQFQINWIAASQNGKLGTIKKATVTI